MKSYCPKPFFSLVFTISFANFVCAEETLLRNGHQLAGKEPIVNDKLKSLYEAYHSSRGDQHCSSCKKGKDIPSLYPKALKILDVGAGNCRFAKYLQDSGYDVYGVEFSTLAVREYCGHYFSVSIPEKINASARIHNLAAKNIIWRNNTFDLVTSFEVLEHIPDEDQPATIAAMVRVSRGRFFGSIPSCRTGRDPPFPHPAILHIAVHPRSWWDNIFAQNGCFPDYDVLEHFKTSERSILPNNPKKRMAGYWKYMAKCRYDEVDSAPTVSPYGDMYAFRCPHLL